MYLVKSFPNIKYFVYADDIQLFSIFSHNHNMPKKQYICLCANPISNWLLENNLLLNKNKTVLLNISLTEVKFPVVTLSDIIIKPLLKVKSLGFIIDNKLSFKLQISNICKTANMSLYKIKAIRK